MQINGTSITSGYSPKTNTESKEQSRLPAVIDATPLVVDTTKASLLPAVTESSSYPASTTVNDEQRSRFIRLLADALPTHQQQLENANNESLFRPVTTGVDHYNQIANLNTEPQQRLFDAIV